MGTSMTRRTWTIALLLLVGCATASQPAGSGGSAPPGPVRSVLPNGVVVIAQEHRASEIVALQLWVRVGGRDEAPAELGLSHYLEHMLFKGTPTRPPGSIDRLIEGLGGRSNAFTSHDFTHYDIVIPAAHLRAGVELLADIAVNASFDQGELDAERKVVFEEMRLTQDRADQYLIRQLYETAYAPHQYGRPILGTPELIGALTREQLARFYTKLYRPQNMVLVAVGAVTPAQVRAAADATFGRLRGGPGGRAPIPAPAPLDGGRRVDVRRPEQQAHLGMAWRVASMSHQDVYAVDLLNYVLGDGPSSRLNQAVRERARLVFQIDSAYGAWDRAGLLTVTARLEPGNVERAERAILDVIRTVQTEGITEAERQRAIVTAESNYAFDIETAEGLAKTYGTAEVTWTLEDELQYLARLRKVTGAEMQAAARKYLGENNYARVRFLPQEAR
jgi:zinc protease